MTTTYIATITKTAFARVSDKDVKEYFKIEADDWQRMSEPTRLGIVEAFVSSIEGLELELCYDIDISVEADQK